MTHKVAIIKTREFSGYYDDYSMHKIVESITDWCEITDEDFRTLQMAAGHLGFTVLEQPTDTPKFIAKSVAEYTAIARAEEERRAEEKRQREEASLQRSLKKELKASKTKKALYEKLKEEFETK